MARKKKNPVLAAVAAGSMIPILAPARQQTQTRTQRAIQSAVDRAASRTRQRIAPTAMQSSAMGVSARSVAQTAQAASSTVMAAPVSAGMMMRGANFQFGAAPVRGGLTGVRITGRQIWATVGQLTGSTNVLIPYGGGNAVQSLTFDPDDTKTMPPPITSLASSFVRYSLERCRLIFTPSQTTASTTSVAFAVETDAANIASIATAPSFFNLLQHSNSAGGPVWAMSSIDVPCDRALRFIYQSVADSSLSTAEQRQDHAFGVVAAGSGNGTTGVTLGYLHIEYTLDFYEVWAGSTENALIRLQKRMSALQADFREGRVERKEVKTPARDGEEKEPSPSLEDLPQASLSGGWSVVPTVLRGVPSSVTVTPRSEQAGSVRSRSLKS